MSAHIGDDEAGRIARSFVAARRDATALADFPGDLPAGLDDAYRVQDAAIALKAGTVAGWKVGRINPSREGVNRFAGPIFADTVASNAATPVAMPVFADGFAAVEAEFLLRIAATPDPAKLTYTMDETRALVDAVHVGIEIASSPLVGITRHGPSASISDLGNNNGLVVGGAIDGWADIDIGEWPVEMWVNGERIGAATAATMLDGPFGAVRFLLELLAARGIALKAGQWVSTGAVTGVHQVAAGDRVEARFGDGMSVRCTIAAQ